MTSAAPSALTTTVPVFTTEYCYTAVAACPTSVWTATYTIQEVCTGDQATWTKPSVPPHFTTTTVTCDVCATPTQTITCPEAGNTGVWGNGVTAEPATTTLDTWWDGLLLTQTTTVPAVATSTAAAVEVPKPTVTAVASSKPTYVQSSASATVWKNLAVLSGAMTVAVGVFLWN